MPYSDFIEREDVYTILQRTLEGYFGGKVTVHEKKGSPPKGSLFYCFPRINAIIPVYYKSDIKDYLERDNNITYSFARRIIMNSYLSQLFKHPDKHTDRYIDIQSARNDYESLLIYPGNKKIKIMDFNRMTIDCVVKRGFSDAWFNKELEIRKNPKWDFILPLEALSSDIYREKLIIGYPFVRLDAQLKFDLLPVVEKYIEQIQEKATTESIAQYSSNLLERIRNLVISNNDMSDVEKNRIMTFAIKLAEINTYDSYEIKLTLSHGDLQKGNLFLESENRKLWMLDWETWEIRSEYYDRMLFYYNLRNSSKILKNLRSLLADKGRSISLNNQKTGHLKSIIRVFLLEDIVWQLEETIVLPKSSVSNGLRVLLSEGTQEKVIGLVS